jgi:hypothetical protein
MMFMMSLGFTSRKFAKNPLALCLIATPLAGFVMGQHSERLKGSNV